jgi:hypothetical protein
MTTARPDTPSPATETVERAADTGSRDVLEPHRALTQVEHTRRDAFDETHDEPPALPVSKRWLLFGSLAMLAGLIMGFIMSALAK